MALELRVEHYLLSRKSVVRNMLIACVAVSIILASCLTLFLNSTQAAPTDDFVTTWKTDNPGFTDSTSIRIPTDGGGYNYDVDWDNDGIFDEFGITGDVTHDFGIAGTYTVRIQGSFPRIHFNGVLDAEKIISVDQWGTGVWSSMENAFNGAINLTISASDTPDLSAVQNMSRIFAFIPDFNSDISAWNTSNITDMSGMFIDDGSFNQDLSSWDTSNVTTMHSMFLNATSFNQDISAWNTSNVTNMDFMFSNAFAFNQDLSSWNTINVTSMIYMFNEALAFNQDISAWNTINVTNMNGVFLNAAAFNQDISSWDTSSVSSMDLMFLNATSFDQDLGDWDMSSVTDAAQMLDSTSLSIQNYDSILAKWSTQSLQQGIAFGGMGLLYCTSAVERQYIITTFNWMINTDNVGCTLTINGVLSTYFQAEKPIGTKVGPIAGSNFNPRAINPFALSCVTPGADDNYFAIGGMAGTDLVSTQTFDFNAPADADADNAYDICVQGTNDLGRMVDTNLTIVVSQLKTITGVEFVPDNGKMFLVVTGEGFVNESTGEYNDALSRSLVTLNGTALPFCTSTTPYSAADFVNQGGDPAYFSDTPPCYYAFDQNADPLITSTEARIELASSFDITAQGSVSINGSDPFIFNAPTPINSSGTSQSTILGAPDTGLLQQLRHTITELIRKPWTLVGIGAISVSVFIVATLVARRQIYHGRIRP